MITTTLSNVSAHLSESYLWSMVGEHLSIYMRDAPASEMRVSADAWLALSGEPVAVFNWAYVGPGPHARERLREFARVIEARAVPTLVFLADSVSRQLGSELEQVGLRPGGLMPLMVLQPKDLAGPDTSFDIARVTTDAQLREMHHVLAGAFALPIASLNCVCTLRQLEGPGIESFLATRDGVAMSTVTAIRSGPVVGIWSMATAPEHQRKGAGYALLAHVIADYADRGVTTFYLGSTPEGFPLYQRLGFTTVADAPFWIAGRVDPVSAR